MEIINMLDFNNCYVLKNIKMIRLSPHRIFEIREGISNCLKDRYTSPVLIVNNQWS